MKNVFTILFCNLLVTYTFAQAPEIEWENTIGGNGYEYLGTIEPTPDGGYIMSGFSESKITGDKTETCKGSSDYWVVKVNSIGVIQWQNTIQGNNYETLGAIKPTNDGGFILSGYSTSGLDYDKTENNWDAYDLWILKLDSLGAIQWQNTIGGTNQDYLYAPVIQTTDGGYILCSTSYSDIGGDKNDHNRDAPGGLISTDYWVVKLNSLGIIQWQKTIGSNGVDDAYCIKQTMDGGYIIGGTSSAAASWEKSENGFGSNDFWIVKINAYGDIEWDKTIGGDQGDNIRDIIQTADGNYIACGSSNSTASGLKTEGTVGGENFTDIWLLKLNSTGDLIWQQTIGGNYADGGQSLQQTADGGLIIGAYSQSTATGDKTEPNWDVAHPFTNDFWLIKTDEFGFIEWQKTIGGNNSDLLETVAVTPDGGFIIGGESISPVSGNKSEPVFGVTGDYDYWIVKIAGSPCSPDFETCNGIDDDCNGLIDNDVTETCTIVALGPTAFCPGGSVELNATFTGTNVQWKKNGVPIVGATTSSYSATSKGTYSCETISDCDTAQSNEIFVNVYKNPSAFISPDGPTIFCTGGSVLLSVTPVAGCTYQWYKGATPIAGATSLTYTATTSGNYKCRVTKTATGCYKNSNAIAVSVPCREENNTLENTFSIYPNPANNFITIETDFSTKKTIYLTDALGQIVKTITTSENNITIDLQGIASGVYFIKMEDGINSVTQKFIKQ